MATVAEIWRFQLRGTDKGCFLFQKEIPCRYYGKDLYAKEFRHFYSPENPGTILVGPERGSLENSESARIEDVVFPKDEFPPDDPE